MVVNFVLFIVEFPHCDQNDLYEWYELTTDQPDVHQPHIRSGWQLFHHTSKTFSKIPTDLTYLINKVVSTNMTVRFTVKAASKKKAL